MSWKHWTAVLVVIGAGILLQIPRRGDMPMLDHQQGADAAVSVDPNKLDDEAGPYRTVSLEVTGMTCETCPAAARMAVKRVEGVKEATFSWPAGTGAVTYDPTMTSPAAFTSELARVTGFAATVQER